MTAALVALAAGLVGIAALVWLRWTEVAAWRQSLVRYRLVMPRDLRSEEVTSWLGQIAAIARPERFSLLPPHPVGLEVDSSDAGISHFLLVPKTREAAVLAALRANLSRVRVTSEPDADEPIQFRSGVELRGTSFWRPLADDRAEDTARAVLAALQPLSTGARVRVQWLFAGVRTESLDDSLQQVVNLLRGTRPQTGDRTTEAKRKLRLPLLVMSGRVAEVGAGGAAQRVASALRGMDAGGAAIARRWLPRRLVAGRVERRVMPLAQWPLVLNTAEAVGVVALSSGGISLPGLPVGAARTVPPPVNAPRFGLVIGESTYPGPARPLRLLPDDRLRHVYVLGPTGVGKSELLAQMALQDLESGYGGLVIDPKADLCEAILARLPEHRRDDVVLLDPADLACPVGINPLRTSGGEHQRELAAETTVTILRSIFRAYWGPRTDDLLRAAVASLVQVPAPDGSAFTLVEVPELLTSPALRAYVARHPQLHQRWREYWQWYDALSEGERLQAIGPVLNKLRAFTMRTSLRLAFGQSAGFDLTEIFTRRRVVLVPLGKGAIGTEAATLLGAFIVGAFWHATLTRATVPAAQRRPVMALLDEFQNVVRFTDDVAEMLAEARGLGVSLTLAHQYIRQVPETIRAALLGTTRTQIVFQLDHDDARVIEHRFAPVLTAADLKGLPTYEIAARLCVEGSTQAPVTGRTLPLNEPTTDPAVVRAELAARWGMARADIEAGLSARRTVWRPARLGELPTSGGDL